MATSKLSQFALLPGAGPLPAAFGHEHYKNANECRSLSRAT